jgi:hypothetical protein
MNGKRGQVSFIENEKESWFLFRWLLVRPGVKETIGPMRGVVLSTRRFPLVLVAVAACVMIAMACYAPTAKWLAHTRGEHMVRADAEGRIQLDVPERAFDIRYAQHSHSDVVIAADFAIKEDDFVAWAERQGWVPEPTVGAITVWPGAGFGDYVTVVKTKGGLSYKTIRRPAANALSGIYDRGTHCAYFILNSEPRDRR